MGVVDKDSSEVRMGVPSAVGGCETSKASIEVGVSSRR